jgi:hypothetical protein
MAGAAPGAADLLMTDASPSAAVDLAAVEARLRALLEPYAALLELATIYGIPTLRRPGANAHDWFAFVKPAARHVSLFLLPVVRHPELVAELSPGLRRHHTGKSTFTFRSLSDAEAAEVEALLARAYEVYTAG